MLLCAALVVASLGSAQGLLGPIQAGDTEAFHAALEAGADINATDEHGQTPLLFPMALDRPAMVKALNVSRADDNARTLAGWTPLHYEARPPTSIHIFEVPQSAEADARNRAGQTHGDIAASATDTEPENTDTATRQQNDPPDEPIPTKPEAGISSIAAGASHSLALLHDGTVMAWGENSSGQLGDGTNSSRPNSALIPGLTNVHAIAAGGSHSLALLHDGTVMAWGQNSSGQLGDGTNSSRPTPTPIPGLTNVHAIAAGGSHSLALLHDGTVMAWGANYAGQMGDGTTTPQQSPTPVHGVTNVRVVSAGGLHSLALLHDGTVMAWGSNTSGQLGDGTATRRGAPVPTLCPCDTNAIAAGDRHSLALLQDGTIMSWGTNSEGQLGDGTTESRPTPAPTSSIAAVLRAVEAEKEARALEERRAAERAAAEQEEAERRARAEQEAAERRARAEQEAAERAAAERRARADQAAAERQALQERALRLTQILGERADHQAFAQSFPMRTGSARGWYTIVFGPEGASDIRVYVVNEHSEEYCGWNVNISRGIYVYPVQGILGPPSFDFALGSGSQRLDYSLYVDVQTGECLSRRW